MPKMIAFATFIFASLLLSSLAARAVQRAVPPPVPLAVSEAGLQQGEIVQATRSGDAAAPRAGTPALYLADWPGGTPPADARSPRQGRVGFVARLEGGSFFLEGADAGIPLQDYVGRAVGVLASPAGLARVGAAPSR